MKSIVALCSLAFSLHIHAENLDAVKLKKNKIVSCTFMIDGEKESCIDIIGDSLKDAKNLVKSCVRGEFKFSRCTFFDSVGKCIHKENSKTEAYYYYETVKQNAETLQRNCEFNGGHWVSIDLEEELFKQVQKSAQLDHKKLEDKEVVLKGFSKKIFDYLEELKKEFKQYEETHIVRKSQSAYFKSLENYFEKYKEKHKEKTKQEILEDSKWFDPFKEEAYVEIWNRLEGGCGTLASFLCVDNLEEGKTSIQDIDENVYRHKATTSYRKRVDYYKSQNLCVLPKIALNSGCASYDEMKKYMDLGCSLEISMETGTEGHVEFVRDVYHSQKLGFCYGVSNSWGNATIFMGGTGDFYHGNFSKFNNKNVFFGGVCQCNDKILESYREEALNFVKNNQLEEALKLYLVLSEKNHNLDEAESLAYEGLKSKDYSSAELGAQVLKNILHYKKDTSKILNFISMSKASYLSRSFLYEILDFDFRIKKDADVFVLNIINNKISQDTPKEAALRVILKLVRSDKKISKIMEEYALNFIDDDYFMNRILSLRITREIYLLDLDFQKIWMKIEANLSKSIARGLNDIQLIVDFNELLSEFLKNKHYKPLMFIAVMEELKYGKVRAIQLMRDIVSLRLHSFEALEISEDHIRNSQEDIRIESILLLTDLVKYKFEPAVQFAHTYLDGVKAEKKKKNYYMLELEKELNKSNN